jgi:predicted dehydrogenase
MSKLRVGVIGLGYFGERHSRVYRGLNHVDLVAVCDRDPARAGKVAGDLGATAYGDFRELLARDDIDAVRICMPDREHTEAAVAAAGAKKAILLEKPLAHDAAHARKIVGAVEANGVRFMVGHLLRFDPRYVQVYEASRPERLGKPLHVKAKRNSIRANARRVGGAASILFYMGVHDIDAMQWVARSRISRVYAQKIQELGHGNEDALYAVVNFENGAIGNID